MTKRRVLLVSLAVAVSACGGLDSPDLTTGAVAGRLMPVFPGGRAYVLGQPEVQADLDSQGDFYLAPVQVGEAEIVVFDGYRRAGRLRTVVRGGEIVWVGPAPDPTTGGGAGPQGPQGPGGEPGMPGQGGGDPADYVSPLPLAGEIVARATADGVVVDSVRFDVEGTDRLGVAPDPSGVAVLTPLPPGTYQLVARAPGFAETRILITLTAGETVPVDLTLTRP